MNFVVSMCRCPACRLVGSGVYAVMQMTNISVTMWLTCLQQIHGKVT